MKVIPKALLKKHAKVKRMPKSNKRMKRHFDDGGDVEASLPDFDPSQIDNPAPTLGPVNYDNLSFGKAFALARKMGNKTFKWRGGSYGTQLAQPGQAKSPSVAAADKAAARQGAAAAMDIPEVTSTASRLNPRSAAADMDIPEVTSTASRLNPRSAAAAMDIPEVTSTASRLNPRSDADSIQQYRMTQQALMQDAANRANLKAQNRSYTDADRQALILQAIQNAKNTPRQQPGYMYGSPNMKKGGKVGKKVAKYAKGGHIGSKRGDGLAQKGKTKGRVR